MITRLVEVAETGSTNEDVKVLAEAGAPQGTVVKAGLQNAGKGRRGRVWQSPGGVNLYFSLLLRPEVSPDKAPMLTLLMALAVARAVKAIYEEPESESGPEGGEGIERSRVAIKWPNDVVVNRKKICGILLEMKPDRERVDYIAAGVGVNVNMADLPEEITDSATSLLREYHRESSPDLLLEHITAAFEEVYHTFEREQNLEFIRAEYNDCLVSMDEEVRILDPKGEFAGVSRGITATGELLVEKPGCSEAAELIKVYAGEVSVRGMNHYV